MSNTNNGTRQSLRQAERRKQAMELEARWNAGKATGYNTPRLSQDSVQRIRKIAIDTRMTGR